jgi:hypothetical protein
MVGEHAAEQRADDGGHAEHRAERALVATALAQRDDLTDACCRGDREPSPADALHGAHHDQHGHAVGEAAEERADDEDEDADLEDPLAAEQITELSGKDRRDRLGEHVRGHDPAHVPGTAEIADDRRERGGHDRLVQRRQEHPEHDRAEDDVHLRARQRRGCVPGGSATYRRRLGLGLWPTARTTSSCSGRPDSPAG